MKKIIPILLTVVLIFTLTIPAFADDTSIEWGGIDLTGTSWDIPTNWNDTSFEGKYNVNGSISYTMSSVNGPFEFDLIYLGYDKDFSAVSFPYFTFFTDGNYKSGFGNSALISITFTGGTDVKNSTLINWLNTYGTLTSYNPPICDGSACPANDANLDGVCDDCGSPMTMSLRSPTLEEMKASAPYYHYFIYKTVDTTTGGYVDHRLSFVTSDSPMALTSAEWDRTNDSAWGSVSFRFTGDSDIDGVNYVSTDGGLTWQRETTYSNGTTLFYVDENFVSSTFDFHDRDTGELFFPLPLWEIIQGVTAETMETQTLGAVAGTITTLTLCGVGLMALLVVLSLFGKRSLISRS